MAPLSAAILLLFQGIPPSGPGDAEALIGRLKTDDPGERGAALEELRKMGRGAVPAALKAIEGGVGDFRERVAALVRKLSSAEWKERDEAARALAGLGRSARSAVEEHLASGDPEVAWRLRDALAGMREGEEREARLERARDAALCAFLGEAGDARAVRPLLKRVESGVPEARVAAAEAVGRLREHMDAALAEESAERVLEALSDPRDPPAALEKARLIRVLGRLGSPACVRPLSALLADRSERNLHVKRQAMAALASAGGAPAFRALIEALASDEVYLRQGAAALLAGPAGEGFGYDPMGSADANRPAVLKYRGWWSARFGREWEE